VAIDSVLLNPCHERRDPEKRLPIFEELRERRKSVVVPADPAQRATETAERGVEIGGGGALKDRGPIARNPSATTRETRRPRCAAMTTAPHGLGCMSMMASRSIMALG
jgi:hypothetical protein